MRIIASVQAKRCSSRGLVHYIAHSKLDIDREPEKGRDLFNTFANDLSVESANNSLKMGIGNARPSNEELHHLVLSFRPDDYRSLGRDEKARRRAMKDVTRAAMMRLENALAADRLSWAAAVHLNTGNPHVHVALQKQYFTREIERDFLTKIPREALPHYELRDGEKVLVPGFLIEGATKKMEHIIALEKGYVENRNRSELRLGFNAESASEKEEDRHRGPKADRVNERDILRRGVLAEYELHRIESRANQLIDHGDKMRFLVADPRTGRKMRLSLQDLEQRRFGSDSDLEGLPERQIKTILRKMIEKEGSAKDKFRNETADAVRQANRVRAKYRKNDWKLPIPSLTKGELDGLQEYCLEDSEVRRFSYLEGVRSELERAREIEPRSKEDFGRIAAQRTVSNMRAQLHERNYMALSDRRYYRFVEIVDKRSSVARLDRQENAARNPVWSFVQKLKDAASRLSGKIRDSKIETENDRPRKDIMSKLHEQLEEIKREQKTEQNKAKILEKITFGEIAEDPIFSLEHLTEIDALSLRLKLNLEYENNWAAQRTLIGSAGNDCPAYRKMRKANPSADFAEHKTSVIAGRALAKEIMAKVELEKAKEALTIFTESKRFQKFAIEDKKTGAVEFVSLQDVDLPKRGSTLDRAVDELFESGEHRRLRRTVTSLMKDSEGRLSNDVAAAKEIVESASRNASEFKQVSLFGLKNHALYQPMFTSSEITAIEIRIMGTRNPREADRLRTILESVADKPLHSLAKMLRDFENPEVALVRDRETGLVAEPNLSDSRSAGARGREERTDRRSKTPHSLGPTSHDHSR